MIKGVTDAHLGPIWYHSEPSDVTYSPNQFLALGLFFAVFYSNTALGHCFKHSLVEINCQRCNHCEIFGAPSAMVGQNLPPWLE